MERLWNGYCKERRTEWGVSDRNRAKRRSVIQLGNRIPSIGSSPFHTARRDRDRTVWEGDEQSEWHEDTVHLTASVLFTARVFHPRSLTSFHSLHYVHAPFHSVPNEVRDERPSRVMRTGKEREWTRLTAQHLQSYRSDWWPSPGCFHVVYSPPSLVSCRFLPSVSHSVRITPLRFAPLTTLLPEGTDEPVRRWYDGSECKVRGSGAVHVSLRSSHLRPFGPLFVSRSAPRAAPLPPAARKVRRDREWVSYA